MKEVSQLYDNMHPQSAPLCDRSGPPQTRRVPPTAAIMADSYRPADNGVAQENDQLQQAAARSGERADMQGSSMNDSPAAHIEGEGVTSVTSAITRTKPRRKRKR